MSWDRIWKWLWGVDQRSQAAFKSMHDATNSVKDALSTLDGPVTVVAKAKEPGK